MGTIEPADLQQLRVAQETACRRIAEEIKPKLPPGSGFVLFIVDYTPANEGNISYVATVHRDDMRRTLIDFLIRTGGMDEAIVAYIQEQIEIRSRK